MHKKLDNKDLVVVTLALPGEDRPAEEVKKDVARHVTKAKLPFINLLLDEKDAFWQAKFKLEGPPQTYVFDRQGKWTVFDAQQLQDAGSMDKLVEELLREK